MSIFSIFNCGTAFDRTKNDIIADLGRNAIGVENRDWIINAGPGAAPGLAKADQLTGMGMYETVEHSLGIIGRVNPRTVNMVGWSRGSISSLMVAQRLRNTGIRCNLFLFDPVVGDPVLNAALHHDAPIDQIGSHVTSLEVVQQLDATDFIFQAHDPFDGKANQARRTAVYQLPGMHSSAVIPSPKYMSSYRIGQGLVADFLHEHGTRMRGYRPTRTEEYLEHYSSLWLELSSGSAFLPGRSVVSNRAQVTRLGDGRIMRVMFNHHHIAMLNAHAPNTAKGLLFALTSRSKPHPAILDAAERERARFPARMPKTKRYLEGTVGWLHSFNRLTP